MLCDEGLGTPTGLQLLGSSQEPEDVEVTWALSETQRHQKKKEKNICLFI